LSPFNQQFLADFKRLRDEKGNNYTVLTPEAAAAAAALPQEAKKPKREKKEKAGPRRLLRCDTCGEQPGHPNHPGDHTFVDPPAATAPDPNAPAKVKQPRQPRQPKGPREKKSVLGPGPYTWCGDDNKIAALAAGNPKYKANNSGRAIVDAIKGGAGTPELVRDVFASHERWKEISLERLQFAFGQLIAAQCIS
jgi:hypothetical protein